MPDPVKLLNTLDQAIAKTRQLSSRCGHYLNLADADKVQDVIIVGDLHGNLANFQAIYKLAELAKNPGRQLILQELIHGKFLYPTGADKSHQLVDLYSALKCQYPDRVHYLPGNHELAQATNQLVLKNDVNLNQIFNEGVTEAYGTYAPKILEKYFQLFAVSPVAIELPQRVFATHTTPHAKHLSRFETNWLRQEDYPPDESKPGGLLYSHLWGRDTTWNHTQAYLAKVNADWLITGHIPCETGFEYANDRLLVLDCAKNPGGYAHVSFEQPLTKESFLKVARVLG